VYVEVFDIPKPQPPIVLLTIISDKYFGFLSNYFKNIFGKGGYYYLQF
jgi:hypothetical protein